MQLYRITQKNTIGMEADKHSQEEIKAYYIDMSRYQLSDIKFLPLSVNKEKVERFLIGKWVVFKAIDLFHTEKGIVEFGENNKILYSSIHKSDGNKTLEWNYIDHKYDDNYSFNAFYVNGFLEMDIVYIDEHLMYARGGADKDILFIKEDSIDMFKDLNSINRYLYNKENYWQNLFHTFTEKHPNEMKVSLVAIWIGLTPTSLLFVRQSDNTMWVWGWLFIVGIVIGVALIIYYKLRNRSLIKKYIEQYQESNIDDDTSKILKARLAGKYKELFY